MDRPHVERGDWIMLKACEEQESVEARVYNVHDDGSLFVGYHMGSFKTMKAKAVWADTYWKVVG